MVLTHHNARFDQVGGKSASRGRRVGVHFYIRHRRVTVVHRLERTPAHISAKVITTPASEVDDRIDPQDASHEETLVLGVLGDVLESVASNSSMRLFMAAIEVLDSVVREA